MSIFDLFSGYLAYFGTYSGWFRVITEHVNVLRGFMDSVVSQLVHYFYPDGNISTIVEEITKKFCIRA